MPRGDKRGNKETKKPKAPKPEAAKAAPGYLARSAEITVGRGGRPAKPGGK